MTDRETVAALAVPTRRPTRAVLRAVGMVLVVGSTVPSSVTLYRVEQQRCETRREANRAIRSAIVTAVDEAATYAHVPRPSGSSCADESMSGCSTSTRRPTADRLGRHDSTVGPSPPGQRSPPDAPALTGAGASAPEVATRRIQLRAYPVTRISYAYRDVRARTPVASASGVRR